MKAIALLAGLAIIGIAGFAFAQPKESEGGIVRLKIGDTTDIKAKDGSTHRLMFASGEANGKKFSGWVATSTDTGVHFQDGQVVTILGKFYTFHQAGNFGRLSAFAGGAFVPVS